MTKYCYLCCEYCKHHEKCNSRDGGCSKCDYWKYGECRNRKKEH